MKREILVDARGLAPPEPMERVLDALDAMKRGDHVRFLSPREPLPLYPLLQRQGYRFEAHPCEDGSFEVLIQDQESV